MTDKERAQERRALANELRAQRNYIGADYLDRSADELDPPKPKIPDGHVWYRRDLLEPWRAGVCDGSILLLNCDGDRLWPPNNEIIPARTLAPGQVAVDRKVIVWAEDFLRSELHTIAADRLQAALDRAEQEVSE